MTELQMVFAFCKYASGTFDSICRGVLISFGCLLCEIEKGDVQHVEHVILDDKYRLWQCMFQKIHVKRVAIQESDLALWSRGDHVLVTYLKVTART